MATYAELKQVVADKAGVGSIDTDSLLSVVHPKLNREIRLREQQELIKLTPTLDNDDGYGTYAILPEDYLEVELAFSNREVSFCPPFQYFTSRPRQYSYTIVGSKLYTPSNPLSLMYYKKLIPLVHNDDTNVLLSLIHI